jgi:hypothetical protein
MVMNFVLPLICGCCRNLFAIDYIKLHPKTSTTEFALVYANLDAATRKVSSANDEAIEDRTPDYPYGTPLPIWTKFGPEDQTVEQQFQPVQRPDK